MNAPLQGQRIGVTRPAAQAGALARMIAAQGGAALLLPLLEIAPPDDPQPLRQAIARLGDYACAIFISPNAVTFSLSQILAAGPWPSGLQAAAIGPGSAAQLTSAGLVNVVSPADRFDSEALLELPVFQAGAVSGTRILILRGNGGRELLAETLRQRGAKVDAVTCYHRSAPVDAAPIVSLLCNRQLDALTISSSEGLRNLLALLDTDAFEHLRNLPLFVPHQRIAQVAAQCGLRRVMLTAPADAGIIESLCAYNWLHHE
jgi:uroporphyrinogen-III synthase